MVTNRGIRFTGWQVHAPGRLPASAAGPAASPPEPRPGGLGSACFPHHRRLALGHQGAPEQVAVRAVDGPRRLLAL